MEHVEEIALSEVAQQTKAASLRGRVPRWLIPSLALHLALLIGVVLSSRAIVSNMELLGEQARAQRDEIMQQTAGLAALTEETGRLRSDIGSLKMSLFSSSTEDVLFLKTTILKPDISPDLARTIAKSVRRYSELYGKDANLALSIIAVESNFNPKAVSSAGALGLMQVMPQWQKVLGIEGELTDPDTSIKYGLQILGFYQEMYRDVEMALTAYNRGPGPVDMALMRGKDPRNNYAPKVLATYERLKRLTVAAPPGTGT